MKKIISSKGAPTPIGPYSHGNLVDAGQMLFVSGQVGKDAISGEIVKGDIKAETHKVMGNIKSILTEGGMEFGHVVKTTIFLKDLNNFSAVNEAYGSYFTGNFPARETVEVSRLPLDVNVEISVIAVKS
jgi:2-iminobutanoate/2-iminopropanoate deaminase